MKRVLVTIMALTFITGVAAVFAEGQVENGRNPYGFSSETISITGQIYFENREFPELISGSKEYELMVPRYYQYDSDLEEGQTITVEGFLAPETGAWRAEEEAGSEENHLRVTKAIIDGVEYDLGQSRGGMMGSSDSRYGRNNRGPGDRSQGRGAMMGR
jgi:hypothetical protein